VPHIKLLIQFDGTDFHGWQAQRDLRTVQGTLALAVARMAGDRVTLRSSSRTDAGVHARAMPVQFQVERQIPPSGWVLGLNSLLPPDLSVISAEDVTADFDVRRSSLGKTYRYCVWNAPHRAALTERYAWHVPARLDLDPMREASRHLLGEHDFSAFRAAHCDSLSTVRNMERIEVSGAAGDRVEIEVRANAFLRNMVRIIAGTLVEVGAGRFTPAEVARMLADKDRTRAGKTAPARGLFLHEVHYP
jgi:tRNA pseudouridine38-40 synthase